MIIIILIPILLDISNDGSSVIFLEEEIFDFFSLFFFSSSFGIGRIQYVKSICGGTIFGFEVWV